MNTEAAEVLYKTVADWCSASPTTTVLDICCGTGTIGQTMSKVNIFSLPVCYTNDKYLSQTGSIEEHL